MKIDVGCGSELDVAGGWTGVDPFWNPPDDFAGTVLAYHAWDVGGLSAGSAEEIRSHHALEHLPPTRIKATLAEWFRLLVPGGLLDLIVPDAVYCLQHFMDHPYSPWAFTMIHGRNDYPGDRHLTAFDVLGLHLALADAGFDVVQCEARWTDKWHQRSICALAKKPEVEDGVSVDQPSSADHR